MQAEASQRTTEEGAVKLEQPDEEKILARVQRLAKAKQLRAARETAAAATRSAATVTDILHESPASDALRRPPSPAVGRPFSPVYTRTDDGDVDVEGAGQGPVAAGGVSGIGEGAAANRDGLEKSGAAQEEKGRGAAVPTGSAGGGSMMAMGIQAFLEESQKRP